MKKYLFVSAAVIGTFAFSYELTFAQTQPDVLQLPDQADLEASEEDVLLVTGSRLARGAESEAVRSIDFQEIEERGISTIEQLFRQLSVNSPSISSSQTGGINQRTASSRGVAFNNLSGGTAADLRGLGAGSTLVLVNGRRIAGEGAANGDFADISNIAVESIERVDILTSGASAVYGADAVAGVINIILKKDYSGTTVTARYGNSASGADDIRLSATSGFNWDGGNLTVSGSYNQIDAASTRKFGVKTRDFRSQGGTDRRSLTSSRGVFSLSPESAEFVDRDDFFAGNAFLLPQNSGPIDQFTSLDVFEAVSRGALAERLPVSLIPDSETFAISGRLSQDINSSFVKSVFVDANYAKRQTKTQVNTPEVFLDPFAFAFSDFGIPFENQDPFGFSPFREDLEFRLDGAEFVEAGLLPNNNFDTEGENYAITGGLIGDFNENWNWEASASYSRNDDTDVDTSFSAGRLYSGIFNFETFEETLAPQNVVRGDYLTNPDAQAILSNGIATSVLESTSDQVQLLGIIKGTLLAGRETGGLDVSFGVDHRIETNTGITTISDIESAVTNRRDINGERISTGLFAEASIPLAENFVLNGALRYENVENSGATTSIDDALEALEETGQLQFEAIPGETPFDLSASGLSPRIGAAWQIIDNVKLRATTGRSFRAPNSFEVGQPAAAIIPFSPIIDPASGQILNDLNPFTGELATGSVLAPQVSGGNPNLKRETARTNNFGTEIEIPVSTGYFGIDVDYWTIDYEDRIGSQGLNLTGDFFDNIPADELILRRNADGQVRFIFDGPVNVSEQKLAGVDVKLLHQWSKDDLIINSGVTISKQTKDKRQLTDFLEVENLKGINAPDLRWNATSTVLIGDFSITGILNYTGDYTQVTFDDNSFSDIERDVDSFVTADFQLQYQLPESMGVVEGTRLKIGATNIFNEDPPFLDEFNGFDSSNYDIRRRVLYIEASKNF